MQQTLDQLTTAGRRLVLACLIGAWLTSGCGGGGEMLGDKGDPPAEEPPCKSVPVDKRAEECGT